jgi:hypothetical protein
VVASGKKTFKDSSTKSWASAFCIIDKAPATGKMSLAAPGWYALKNAANNHETAPIAFCNGGKGNAMIDIRAKFRHVCSTPQQTLQLATTRHFVASIAYN